MEDNGRELDPDPVNTPPVKDGHPKSKALTIMLIGSVGKMRSFKISRKLIKFTSVFFLIYIIVSLLIFYLYYDLYADHKAQSDKLQDLEIQLSDKTKAFEQNKLYIKVLEDYRKGLNEKVDAGTIREKTSKESSAKVKAPGKTKSQTAARKRSEEKTAVKDSTTKKAPESISPEKMASNDTKSQETVQNAIEEKPADIDTTSEKAPEPGTPKESEASETKSQETSPEEALIDPMELEDINFQRTDSALTLDFKLTNKRAEQKTAEGYIHIIVMDKNKECPVEWNNSYNKLSNGYPTNFNHGQQFLIQRYRPYQRKYKTNPDSELPSFIRILVFDRSGQKILEKELPVTNEPTNDQS